MRVLLAGGGTAGHTSPLLATAAALQRRDPETHVTALGTQEGLEARVVPDAGYRLELVPRVPLPRRLSVDALWLPVRLGGAVTAAGRALDRVRPDVLVGFGGYVSVPAYLAARRRRVPIVVHEANAVPGVANRLGARLTRNVATSFPDTPLRHGQYLGMPIRRLISALDRPAQRSHARTTFGLDPERPTVLITGGSQGARRLNQAVSGALDSLLGAGVQVLHVVGAAGEAAAPRKPGPSQPEARYVALPYVDRMDLAYAAADLVLCRCGANTVTEVASVGLPAVFVPLPVGNGEQEHNAQPVVDAGGALMVGDTAMTPDWVEHNVPTLVRDADRLQQMSAAAAGLVPRDGDERLAGMAFDVARSSR